MDKHPGGGYFKEVYLSPDLVQPPDRFGGTRPACSTIYYLLESYETLGWHKLKQDEIWFYHAGQPVSIHIKDEVGNETINKIGNQLVDPECQYQVIIPAMHSFSACLLKNDSFILVSCVTAPGFEKGDSV